jgi:hypothetical protein
MPVGNWALPSDDVVSSDERMSQVRTTTANIAQLMTALDSEEVEESLRRHSCLELEGVEPMQPGRSFAAVQQQHMRHISAMLEGHMHKHDEAVQMLEASRPEARCMLHARPRA